MTIPTVTPHEKKSNLEKGSAFLFFADGSMFANGLIFGTKNAII